MSLDPVARQIAAEALTASQSGVAAVSGLSNSIVIAGDYLATSGQLIDADTSAESWTLTLPASGGTVVVRDHAGTWGTNPLTVAGNGAVFAIDGDATALLNASGFQVTFTMINGAWSFIPAYLYGDA